MLNHLKQLFKRNSKKSSKEKVDLLEEAFFQGFITEEELLRLKKERAETKLKEYLKSHKT